MREPEKHDHLCSAAAIGPQWREGACGFFGSSSSVSSVAAHRVIGVRVDVVVQHAGRAAHHVHQPDVQLPHHAVARHQHIHAAVLQEVQHLQERYVARGDWCCDLEEQSSQHVHNLAENMRTPRSAHVHAEAVTQGHWLGASGLVLPAGALVRRQVWSARGRRSCRSWQNVSSGVVHPCLVWFILVWSDSSL